MAERAPVTLIVLAHPEPGSVTAAWAGASARASREAGHEVILSDLCAMGFDPVERAAHYGTGGRFDALRAQEEAARAGRLPSDVAGEVEKLCRADRLILHFPLWWFAPPAILKGWFDRVLAHGATHDVERRFDRGLFAGRRALMCVTTGARAAECGPDGREGDARMLLWPAAQTLRYLGFTVLEPVLLHGIHGYNRDARRGEMDARIRDALAGQGAVIGGFESRAAMPFNADGDFDGDGRLRPGARSVTPFIRPAPPGRGKGNGDP